MSDLIAGVKRLEGVGELFLMTVLCEGAGVVGAAAHRPVPVTDQGIGDHQGNVIGVAPSAA